MDNERIHEWEAALDAAEISLLEEGLPKDAPAGTIYNDIENSRRWLRVAVVRGNTGSRWAYWLRMIDGRHSGFEAVADKVFNGDAAHFVGMLALPYIKVPMSMPTPVWVLIEPRVAGERVINVQPEPVKERYERSKEIYDVENGKTERLP